MQQSQQQHIFEQWISQYKALLFKILRAYAFSPADQEDLFQEMAIQLWRSIPSFQEESAISTWIYRVGLNTALNWKRRERKHQEGRQGFDKDNIILKQADHPADERLSWLYEEIARMDKIDRSLCLLLLDGFSYKEMAGMLGLSESHIGVKIHRIKKHLIAQSQKLDPHGV